MPSADSRIRDGLTSRFAHSNGPPATAPPSLCSSPYRVRLVGSRDTMPTDARDFGSPVFPIFR